MSDLADLENLVAGQDRGAPLTIKHPTTGEPLDIVFIVAGPDSDTARRARLKFDDETYAFRGRPSADELDRMYVHRLARCVIDWKMKREGVSVPFTYAAVVRILSEMKFVRDQVEEFSQSRTAYFLRLPFEGEA